MPDKVITLEYQIPCDRCGFPMKPGTKCLVKMDEKHGKAYFVHIQCPSAPAVAVITVFAMIFLNGIKMVSKDGFNEANSLILAITFGLGYGLGAVPAATAKLPAVVHFLFGEPITAVCLVGVLANLLFASAKKTSAK